MKETLKKKFQQVVGKDQVYATPEDLAVYGYDGTFLDHRPDLVVLPDSTEQVSRILALASGEQMPVVTRGMGSGLAGGSVAVNGGISLVLTRLNRILEIDQQNRTTRVEAGVITAYLQNEVEKLGLFYPPDPSSIRQSTICRHYDELKSSGFSPEECLKRTAIFAGHKTGTKEYPDYRHTENVLRRPQPVFHWPDDEE